MTLLFLLLIPALVAVAGYFLGKGKITVKEFLVQFGVVALLMISGYFFGRCGAMSDTEIWNGRIAEKHRGTHSCCHSYQCNCRQECSGTGKNKSCSTVCDTCYEHNRDLYWSASTTNGEAAFLDRCNRPSSSAPNRWVTIKVGEPTAMEHRFTNYIKGAPGSILKKKGLVDKYRKHIPNYPRVYDHYRVNRFIGGDASLNAKLSELNADLGKKKQVNIIIVVTRAGDRGFLHALEEAWLGGKKNDLVVLVGISGSDISWAGVMSWTKAEEMKLAIRDRVEELKKFDGLKVLGIVRQEVASKFVRRPMADFEYLSSSIEPPFWMLCVLFALGLVVSGGLQYWFWKEDPLDGGFRRRKTRW